MTCEREYFAKKSVEVFRNTHYGGNPQKYYQDVLEETRDWNMNKRHLESILKTLEGKFGEDEHYFEKTSMLANALIHNSTEMS